MKQYETWPYSTLDTHHWLVVEPCWAYPSEKYEFVNWDDELPNIWNNKTCSSHHQPDIPLNHYQIPFSHYKNPLNRHNIPLNHYKWKYLSAQHLCSWWFDRLVMTPLRRSLSAWTTHRGAMSNTTVYNQMLISNQYININHINNQYINI